MRMKMKTIDEYRVGDTDTICHTITEDDVKQFAKLTGDYNPLHLDEEFAGRTSFKKPVVYGMLSASFISTLIGMKIPGPGALWTSQTLEFMRQVYIGDSLTISAEVKQVSVSTETLKIHVRADNQDGQTVLKGEAAVKVLEVKQKEKIDEEKKQKVCLITGATGGIGTELAVSLAKKGYRIALNYGNSDAKAKSVARKAGEAGAEVFLCRADLADESQVRAMVRQIREQVGPVTAVAHCAAPPNPLRDFSELDWASIQKQLDVQLKGAFHCMKYIIPSMIQDKIAGKIVFIGSIAADGTPPARQMDYVIAKSALRAFAKSLAVEYGPSQIAVNVVAPGMTETERILGMPEKAKLMTKMQSPSRRLVQAEEVVQAIEFLLERDSCAITGETLRICGGIQMI